MSWLLKCFIFLLVPVLCRAQYKYDNVSYKTVETRSLCDSFSKYPERVIIDVRSTAEFNEEQMKGMSGHSLGHFKDAINIDVQQLGNRLEELNSFKDKPVFIICSHSQRSRRASLFLSKNGFTNILNINGGMTSIHQLPVAGNECIYNQITSRLPYKLLSAIEMCKEINNGSPFIVDVRPEVKSGNTSAKEINMLFGMFKNTINIPINNLADRIAEVPKNRKIIITDITGDNLDDAAQILISKGYNDVNILNGGIEQFVTTDSKLVDCGKELQKSIDGIHVIGSADLLNMVKNSVKPLFLDLRPVKEFSNNSSDNYKNIGHIKGAVNISVGDLPYKVNVLFPRKDTPIVIYSFSSDADNYVAADILLNNGYKEIYILSRGIFNVRWTANNFKEYHALSDLIADVPDENL